MNTLERVATGLRRGLPLAADHPIWRTLRPLYRRVLETTGNRGLVRTMNGSDTFRITSELYNLLEVYEPEVWRAVMSDVRPGDIVADVGASIGLYTLAFARRVGEEGRVLAFEPDPGSAHTLRRLLELNGLASRVEIISNVVGASQGTVEFVGGKGSESHVSNGHGADGTSTTVETMTLDDVFDGRRVDLIKIDVEGFEEFVLRGAKKLLSDSTRSPRAIFVEVHPFAWSDFGVSDQTLLGQLRQCGYKSMDLAGHPVEQITEYGEIVARRINS